MTLYQMNREGRLQHGLRTSSIDKAGCDYQVINSMPTENLQSEKKNRTESITVPGGDTEPLRQSGQTGEVNVIKSPPSMISHHCVPSRSHSHRL